MNERTLEEKALDHGIEESFPASDPVSVVCLPPNEERFQAAMKAAREAQQPARSVRGLIATSLAVGVGMALAGWSVQQSRAHRRAALRGQRIRWALAGAGAAAGAGILGLLRGRPSA